jgi:hypothetical protein
MKIGNRRSAGWVRAGLAVTLVTGLVACGDDDGDAADSATTIATGASAACNGLVDFNAAASGDTDTSTADGAKALAASVGPLWKSAVDAIPANAKADADVVTAAIDDLANGDPAAFESDATFDAYSRALTAAIDGCGFGQQSVSAADSNGEYHFEGVPATLDAGTIAVTMANTGSEPHVMVVYRKNDGETRTAEELLALPEEEGQQAGSEVGGVFALPGSTSVGLVTLTPGDYVYFCPIPVGDDGPPHFTKGMFGEFTVA